MKTLDPHFSKTCQIYQTCWDIIYK